MRPNPTLDPPASAGQQLVLAGWLTALTSVAVLWATTADFGGLPDWLDAIGMLLGLLATFCALTQVMLMGRIKWITRLFARPQLVAYHRFNGSLVLCLILLHPLFITVSYALAAHQNLAAQYFDLILHYNYVWLALIAELLFLLVGLSMLPLIRRRLKPVVWRRVHLTVYLAIVAASFHQLTVGDSFAGGEHPLARGYWLGLYGFVLLNLLLGRRWAPAGRG